MGFPSVIVIAGKGVSQVAGWLTVQWSFVVTSWALADEWSESVASLSLKRVQSELDFAANLTFEHDTQRKEDKLK